MRNTVRNLTKADVCHLYSTWLGNCPQPGLEHTITHHESRNDSVTSFNGQEITLVDHTGCYRAPGVSLLWAKLSLQHLRGGDLARGFSNEWDLTSQAVRCFDRAHPISPVAS